MKLIEMTAAGKCIGESHGNAKLTYAKVEEMRRLREIEGLSFVKLGKRFGVSGSTAGKAVKGESWVTRPERTSYRADHEETERIKQAALNAGIGASNIARSLGVNRHSVLKIMATGRLKGAHHQITECQHGHPFVGDNIYMTPDGRRQCCLCRRHRAAQSQKNRASRKEQHA